MASAPGKVDRQTTTPFLLKVFYKEGSFTPLSDFHSPLPPHIQLYTWQSCTLRELSHLIATSIPEVLPSPAIGTRLAFRLIYPDTKSISSSGPNSVSNGPGRFLHQDIGSLVIGDGGPGVLPADGEEPKLVTGGPMVDRLGGEPEFMLQDVRFVIGDYIAVAILPPLGNGNVAPTLGPAQALGMGMGIGMGAARGGRSVDLGRDSQLSGLTSGKFGGQRENGFGGFRGRGGRGGWGGPPGPGGPRGVALPSGEWRRGERLPDGPPGAGGRGSYGGGRGRDRW